MNENIFSKNKAVQYIKDKINLTELDLSDEFFYQSLPLCVIDSVFSIGAHYNSTRNVVIRYCNKMQQQRIRSIKTYYPDKSQQQSINEFIEFLELHNIKYLTEEFFQNSQRTSTRNGILKAEAVYKFAKCLSDFNVNYLQDIATVLDNHDFEQNIKKIPGQRSGISLGYFFMLSGNDNYIKPDRMVIRFLNEALSRNNVSIEEAKELILSACDILENDYRELTPRILDHKIWNYQRTIKS